MPITTSSGRTLSDQQIKDWVSSHNDPAQLAAEAQGLGLTLNQIVQAANIAGKNWNTSDITHYANDNGYIATNFGNGPYNPQNTYMGVDNQLHKFGETMQDQGYHEVKNAAGVTHWVGADGVDQQAIFDQRYTNAGLNQHGDGNWYDSAGRQVHGIDGSGQATYSVYDPHTGGNRMVTAEEYDKANGGGSQSVGSSTSSVPVTDSAIAGLYKSVLGRDGNADEIAWWRNSMGTDGTYNQHDIDAFNAAAQAEIAGRKPSTQTGGASSTVVPGTSTGQGSGAGPLTLSFAPSTNSQQFNTPVLNALYANQQQRMLSQAPVFNFQSGVNNTQPAQQAYYSPYGQSTINAGTVGSGSPMPYDYSSTTASPALKSGATTPAMAAWGQYNTDPTMAQPGALTQAVTGTLPATGSYLDGTALGVAGTNQSANNGIKGTVTNYSRP